MLPLNSFNGLGMNLGNLSRLSQAVTRSICSENPTGKKAGAARATPDTNTPSASRRLGQGWKVKPCDYIAAGEKFILADIEGMGAIQSMWMTPAPLAASRFAVLRIFWDDQEQPSVECPLGDFFAAPWAGANEYNFAQLSSQAVCINPGSAFNCFWEMPFRKRCRIELENLTDADLRMFYQINYTLTEVPEDCAYFHAQFRRSNPVPQGEVHTLVDGVEGQGQYVGTSMGWQVNHNGWWGEGELKFYLDGDTEPGLSEGQSIGGSTGFPTICSTGAEDYFMGSYNFENQKTKQYQEFYGPYAGMPQVIRPDGLYMANTRFALYRWHIPDPIRFQKDLKVTIQSLGWGRDGYHQRLDDLSSVAFWYQTLPTKAFPRFPDADTLEIV